MKYWELEDLYEKDLTLLEDTQEQVKGLQAKNNKLKQQLAITNKALELICEAKCLDDNWSNTIAKCFEQTAREQAESKLKEGEQNER